MISAHRQETKQRIAAALLKLIQDKAFKTVTVADILRMAKISRGTFYRYYLDKYDLLDQYEDQLISEMTAIFEKYPKPDLTELPAKSDVDAFYVMMMFIYQHRRSIRTLVNCPETALLAKMRHLIGEKLVIGSSLSIPNNQAESLRVPPQLARALIVENVVTILNYWLNQIPMVSPTAAYATFLHSRLLSPLDLATILTGSTQVTAGHDQNKVRLE
ncbi:TetR/AcrR family transcriptional regulator [Lactiplantibacillus paraxiangfangensis]|uniref:TetR/AcrR family transcriptional regulator n=1 Tax=Lactiplantibacillus paraxiangfangensis TaxID=3076224 RepID=UPI0030C7402E